MLGHLDESRACVSLLNKYKPLFHKTSVSLNPLWMVWDTTAWPEGEREIVDRDIAKMRQQRSASLWSIASIEESDRTEDAAGLRSLVRGLEEKGIWDHPSGGAAMAKSARLVKALEIAISLQGTGYDQNTGDLPSVEEILGWIAQRLHANSQIKMLVESAKCMETLGTGGLARALKVDDEKVQQLAREILETFNQRFEKGPLRSAEVPIRELFKIISNNTISCDGAIDFWNQIDEDYPSTLLRDAISQEEIRKLEERLEVSLPADYKEFLACSNGLGSSWGGIIMEPQLMKRKMYTGSRKIQNTWQSPPPSCSTSVSS